MKAVVPVTVTAARVTRSATGLAILLACWWLPPGNARAQGCAEPAPDASLPAIALEQLAEGFHQPTHLADDGSGRLFVVEQAGVIRVIDNGKLLAAPFLDIRDRVAGGGEKGLFSIAFHPRYRENGHFFVNYTESADLFDATIGRFIDGRAALRTVVARYSRSGPVTADAASEAVLLRIDQPYGNHNGGQLAFGPDGHLYIGTGDGGSADDPHDHGQNLATLLGALLRIDVDRAEPPRAYAIPPDNPFVDVAGARGEIWAYGLRNPWRFSFDRRTGWLYAADVGQNAVEEINIVRKGGNYGWRIMEGDICTPGVAEACDRAGLEMPLYTYRHPQGFAVTGGFVYRGDAIPALCGAYLFGDYATRRIWAIRVDDGAVVTHRELLASNEAISSFGEDAAGEIYVVSHQAGRILKIVAAEKAAENGR